MAEMDSAWEKAINTALKKCPLSSTYLALDGSIKSTNGLLPSPTVLSVLPETLEIFSIANCRISSLQNFPSLPNLKSLNLSDNRISTGLNCLIKAGLKELEELDLSNNKISKIEDLEILRELKELKELDLFECPVTRLAGYREKVFEIVKGLLVLDKVDKDGNEKADSDEEDEEEEDDDGADEKGDGEVEGEVEDEEDEDEEDEDEDEDENEDEGEGEGGDEEEEEEEVEEEEGGGASPQNKRKREN